jgi:large subunit ribosomal protein L37Ae
VQIYFNKHKLKKKMPQELGSVKRFGPRYGRTVKHKLAKIEAVQKGKHKCPYCHAMKAKRLSTGIWHCIKCGAKFTGRAYSLKDVAVKAEEIKEEKQEAKGEK